MIPAATTPTSERTESGKLSSTRDTGNRPARGILGSPASNDSSPDAPVNKPAPDAGFKKAMNAVIGGPTRVPAPGSEDAKEERPRRQQPTRKPARPQRDDEHEDPTADDTADGPPDREQGDDSAPARPTKKGADYSRRTDGADAGEDTEADEPAAQGRETESQDDADEGEQQPQQRRTKQDVLDQDFARRFGIPLDNAPQARKALIDDFAATLSGDPSANQPRNDAGQFAPVRQQPGQFQQNGNGQAQADSGQRAQSDAAQGQRKQLTKEGRAALVEHFGEQITPVADLIEQLQADVTEARQASSATSEYIRQARQRETSQTVNRFFGSKVLQGFGDRYGNQKKGQMSPAQRYARQELVDYATRYQNAKQGRISDDDALEAAHLYLNRDQIEGRARDQGRRQVEQQVQTRHRTLDVSGTPAARPARGTGGAGGPAVFTSGVGGAGDNFGGHIKKFLNGGRR